MSDALRTVAVDVDETFTALGNVTKTTIDAATGKRYIRGVASGVQEDRDGERVSARAIQKMAAQGAAGVKMTASHDQDWLTECGDVVKVEHDRESDELLVTCELPPEGTDPIADKAFKAASTRPLGFSIGGKLKKAYFELVKTGGVAKRRKVLDEILLAHVALTAKPAYAPSFAEAVAKTFTGEAPAAEDAGAWLEADSILEPDVVKAAKAADEPEQPAADPAPAAATADAPAPGDDGTDAANDPAPEGDSDAQADAADAAALPQGEGQRHLACPNCGHEFAAPLSADEPANRTDDETAGGEDAAKTASTAPTPARTMAPTPTPAELDAALEKVRALAEPAAEVAKTEAPEPAAAEVAKTDAEVAELDDVAKAVAAVYRESVTRVDALETKTAEGFGEVVKALNGITERLDLLPRGRKSVARTDAGLAHAGEVAKTAETDEADVAKSIADAPDALTALKAINAARA